MFSMNCFISLCSNAFGIVGFVASYGTFAYSNAFNVSLNFWFARFLSYLFIYLLAHYIHIITHILTSMSCGTAAILIALTINLLLLLLVLTKLN